MSRSRFWICFFQTPHSYPKYSIFGGNGVPRRAKLTTRNTFDRRGGGDASFSKGLLLLLHDVLLHDTARLRRSTRPPHGETRAPPSRSSSRAGHAGPPAGLRVDDEAVAPLRGLDQFGVFFFQDCKVLLGLPGPYAVAGKHEIHLLERTLVRLRVQGPHDDDAEDVDSTKDVERLFVEAGKDRGEQEDAPAVTNRPTDHTKGVASRANVQGEYFGRVKPRDRQPRGPKDGRVQEHKEGRPGTQGRLVALGRGVDRGSGETSGGETAYPLADGAPVQGPPTTDAVQRKDTDQRRKHVGDVVETTDPQPVFRLDARYGEDFGSVDRDARDADPFLQDLQPNDQLDAAGRV